MRTALVAVILGSGLILSACSGSPLGPRETAAGPFEVESNAVGGDLADGVADPDPGVDDLDLGFDDEAGFDEGFGIEGFGFDDDLDDSGI